MGLINSQGSWFEKILGGWIFGSQAFKLIFKGNVEIQGGSGGYEHTFQNKDGVLAHLDDIPVVDPFNPADYDLEEFTNVGVDPYVTVSTLPSPINPNLQETVDIGEIADKVIFELPNIPLDISSGTNNYVAVTRIAPDGKIYMGGSFTTVFGSSSNRIVRLNSDFTIDSSFNIGAGFNSDVYDIKIDIYGKILVVGNFTIFDSTGANRVIRLNDDGSIDTSFVYGTGFNDYVQTIAINSSDEIYIAGNFTEYNGNMRNRIIKLNYDGTIVSAFQGGFVGSVSQIMLDSNENLFCVGAFTSYKETLLGLSFTKQGILKINPDATINTGFSAGTGFNGAAFSCLVDSGDRIFVGGTNFTSYKGTSVYNIVLLDQFGEIESFFNTGSGITTGAVYGLYLTQGDRIFIVGSFTNYNGTSVNKAVLLNTDGTISNLFTALTLTGTFYQTIVQFPSNDILLGGIFTNYNGATVNNIVLLNSDGTQAEDVPPVINNRLTYNELGNGIAEYKTIKTFDLLSTQELVNKSHIDEVIATIPTPTTPTLQEVIDTGESVVVESDERVLDINYFLGQNSGSFILNYNGGGNISSNTNESVSSIVNISSGGLIAKRRDIINSKTADIKIDKPTGVGVFSFPDIKSENVKVNSTTEKSADFTAVNSVIYTTTANLTITDPTPVADKGYIVYVLNGTVTIGGVGYGVGSLVYRFYYNGSWTTTVYKEQKQLRLTNTSVSGTFNLDWAAYDVFELTLTGITTFADINLPTGTNTKIIELIVNGNFALTLPPYWEALPSNDTYTGTKRNHFVVSCYNGNPASEKALYQLETLNT